MTETPSQNDEREDIVADRRREFRLIPQALLALAIVVVVVIVREMFLR